MQRHHGVEMIENSIQPGLCQSEALVMLSLIRLLFLIAQDSPFLVLHGFEQQQLGVYCPGLVCTARGESFSLIELCASCVKNRPDA